MMTKTLKESGFAVVEGLVIGLVILSIIGVGFYIHRRQSSNSSSETATVKAINAANEADPYYSSNVTTQPSAEEVEKANDADPGLRKGTESSTSCGEGNYDLLDSQGKVIGCTHGAD